MIATVDKFAQMAWHGDTQTLFGRSQLRCERHGFITPDLADTCCQGRSFHQARGSRDRAGFGDGEVYSGCFGGRLCRSWGWGSWAWIPSRMRSSPRWNWPSKSSSSSWACRVSAG